MKPVDDGAEKKVRGGEVAVSKTYQVAPSVVKVSGLASADSGHETEKGVGESGRLPSGRKATAYFLPGLFLVIVAAVALGLGVLTILIQMQQGFGGAGIVAGLMLSLMMLMLPTIALIGGIGLLMRRRRVVVVACLCSCFVPCSFAVLGIPLAIWGMIMAGSAQSIRDFRS